MGRWRAGRKPIGSLARNAVASRGRRAPVGPALRGDWPIEAASPRRHAVRAEHLGEVCWRAEQRAYQPAPAAPASAAECLALYDRSPAGLASQRGRATCRGDQAGPCRSRNSRQQPSRLTHRATGYQEHSVAGGIARDSGWSSTASAPIDVVDRGQADVDDRGMDRGRRASGEQYGAREPATCWRQGSGRGCGWHSAFLPSGDDPGAFE